MVGTEAAVVAAAVCRILKVLGNKLAPLLMKKYSTIVGVQNDLKELQDQVEEINYWLETVGDKAMGNAPSFNWLEKLKDVAYDVDDVVDEFQLKAEKNEVDIQGDIISKYLLNKPKSFVFQCKVASKIKTIKKRFEAIVRQRTEFNLIARSLEVGCPMGHVNMTSSEMPSLPIVNVAKIIGRDRDKQHIILKLVEDDDQQRIKMVAIIGLGGSGKTTLAQIVFNDDIIIKKHFEIKLWVHVSQVFDVAKIIEKLFEEITGEKSEQYPLQQMSKIILDKLTGKRYLLVLDDVWTQDRIQWDKFMVHLESGTPESVILLTTRSRTVAEAVGSTSQFDLPFLSPSDSWQLFKQTLVMPAKGWNFDIEVIGKEIVKKCGGVPLAIKVLAGALRGKELMGEWQAMRDNNLLDVVGEEYNVSVSACLRLSYFHMPAYLKQCFTLCSVFPKGHLIDKEQLVDQWIAHDMIAPAAGVDYMEYTGHKYFNSLVQMSFLQEVDKCYGRVRCRMHDLVHDLARSIMNDEISLVVPVQATQSAKSCRYFSLIEGSENQLPENIFEKARAIYVGKGDDMILGKALKNARHLRILTVESSTHAAAVLPAIFQIQNLKCLHMSRLQCVALPDSISNIWSLQALHVTWCISLLELPSSIGKLQKLRTLNMSGCKMLRSLPDSIAHCNMLSSIDLSYCKEITLLPNAIAKDKNLRVLSLHSTRVKRLPSGIIALENLELLNLECCDELEELPEGIGKLKKLGVLNLERCRSLRALPEGIGQLTRLWNLSSFVVGEGKKTARLSEFGNLSRISGNQTIAGLARVMDPADALTACLKQKTNLQKLRLYWGKTELGRGRGLVEDVNTELEQAVFDGLEPPSEIKEIEIVGFGGDRRCALWMLKPVGRRSNRFPLLTEITLSGFPKLRHLDGLVELPCLEKLTLQWMHSLESISGGPFPSLVSVVLWGMDKLGDVWMVPERTFPGGEERYMQIGTRLSSLHIDRCPKLIVKPYLPSSLERVKLERSNKNLLESPSQDQGSSSSSCYGPYFSNLKTLELWKMEAATSSPVPPPIASSSSAPPFLGFGSGHGWELLQHMTALESLVIKDCNGLTQLPQSIRSLTSLQFLCVKDCSTIEVLPQWLGELQSLRCLTILVCRRLRGLPESMGRLRSLQVLQIEWCDELYQLPESLGELRSLRRLMISGLPVGLFGLPESMHRLTSLKQIKICNCPGNLPDWMQHLNALQQLVILNCPGIRSLPDWIRNLTALQKLDIISCPNLEGRCEREKGEDWRLISHIPQLHIGYSPVGWEF